MNETLIDDMHALGSCVVFTDPITGSVSRVAPSGWRRSTIANRLMRQKYMKELRRKRSQP